MWSGAVSEECSPSGSSFAGAAGGRWPDAGVATGRAGVNVGGSGAGSGSQDSGAPDGSEEEVPLASGSERGGSQARGSAGGGSS